ncbi:MAG: insulinase family protein [Clostridia bacterium]|nr:insulinase family protein [Clostridia bacterium]
MIPQLYLSEFTATGARIPLRVCHTEKFKAGLLSLSAAFPIRERDSWMLALLLAVLRRGSEKYPSLSAINRRLDCLYGTEISIRNFYRGDLQIIGFAAELLDDSYLPTGTESLMDGVLELLCQILFHPLLDEEGCLLSRYVESEKQLHCDQIRARKNQPRAYAAERCRELLYSEEPIGISAYGTEEEVMAVTPRELTDFWRDVCRRFLPDCFYVGSADEGKVQSALSRILLPELQAEPVASPSLWGSEAPLRAPLRTEEALAVSQGQLALGFRTEITGRDPRFYAMTVYQEILGSSPIAKLMMNVREKHSLCYSCSSSYNAYKGSILILCGLKNENREKAEREILRQTEDIANGQISDAELAGALASLENAYRRIEDSPSAMEQYYYGRALAGMEITPEELRRRISRVTREDVVAAARTLRLDTVYFLRGTLEEKGGEELDDME